MEENKKKVFNIIKTNIGIFINDLEPSDWTSPYSGYTSNTSSRYIFDGEFATISTVNKNWLFLNNIPNKIATIKSIKHNERYEIISKDLISTKFPEILTVEEFQKCNDESFERIYKYRYEHKDVEIELDFELNIVSEINNYSLPPSFNYRAIGRRDFSDVTYTISNENIKHNEIDKILFDKFSIHKSKCMLTSEQMYEIVRQYIIDNIDLKVATITSNYNFCFTVKKIIPLIEPKTIEYQNLFAKTKKDRSKIKTHTAQYTEKEIFQMTSKKENYKGYTPIEGLEAENEYELKEKLDLFLTNLITEINKKWCQCPNCNGLGILEE